MCASLHVDFTPVVPTVMLVVDRSGSMKNDYGGQSRWQALYTTLMDPSTGIVTQLADQVRFGVTLYDGYDGNPNGTCPTLHTVDPAISNRDGIDAVYSMYAPGAGTPTGESIAAITPTVEAVTEPGPKLMIVATDGLPDTCADPADDYSDAARAAVIDAVTTAHDNQIETFVIGVGPDITDEHMQEVANAGQGLPIDGPQNAPFYHALDASSLVDAFRTIINGARGCEFTLDSAVDPSIAQGTVTLDGNPLTEGTDWQLEGDDTTIQLLGASCDAVLAGGDHMVDAVFVCPPPPGPDAGVGNGTPDASPID